MGPQAKRPKQVPSGSEGQEKKKKKPPQNGRNVILLILIIFGITYFVQWVSVTFEKPPLELTHKEFYDILKNNLSNERIVSAVKVDAKIKGKFADGSGYIVDILPESDPGLLELLRNNVEEFDIKPPRTFFTNLFYSLGPMILFIMFLWFFIYRGAAAGGGKILSFGKSRAKLATEEHMKVTFEDVAGVDEAKEELREVIEFLTDP